MLSRLALGSIYAYQLWISPNKGFRCAHSVLHGGTGCSGFAKYAIRDRGLFAAIPDIRQRFRDCRSASEVLRTKCIKHAQKPTEDNEENDGKKRDEKKAGCNRYDCADVACFGCSEAAWMPFGCCAAANAGTSSSSGDNSGSTGSASSDGDCGPSGSTDCGGDGCSCSPSCG